MKIGRNSNANFLCYSSDMMSNAALEADKSKARKKQVKALQLMFLALPPTNTLLLECLIDMLHRVSRISENMMTAQSLGTVFAPCLLCPRKVREAYA